MSGLDQAIAAEDVRRYGRAEDAITAKMPQLVKGAGFAKVGGDRPLDDDVEIFRRSQLAETALKTAVADGKRRAGTPEIQKALSPQFASEFPNFLGGLGAAGGNGMGQWVSELQGVLQSELGKNITLTSPLSTGLVPYDLVAPSRLIYPLYAPLRNKFPRPAGQGTSRRAKVFTAISGSQTAGAGTAIDISIAELVGQSLTNWPINLPGSGTQNAVDLNITYKFFGLTESISWLSQFAGQGFEDVAALANLFLMQEFMFGEEYQMIAGTGTALAAPGNPTLTARTAGSNETAITGATTDVWVRVTSNNWFGETASSTVQDVACTTGQVVDVVLPAVKPGSLWFNIYVGTGTADPGNSSCWAVAASGNIPASTKVGGVKYTIQGALPTSGNHAPTADTGTSGTNRYEGMASILSGAAATNSVYPSGWQAGYYQNASGKTLGHSVLFDALQHMWDGSATNSEGFRADPNELLVEGSDRRRLSDDVINTNAANLNYRLFVEQDQSGGVKAGALVSAIYNPVTGSTVTAVVHPYLPQGNAFLLSYALPTSWSNVGNVWENVMVQDYLSIGWPVIDASFRYSIFMYGSLVCYAPQYNGLIQGLQQSSSTPYS